jgi:hypothetical protein
MKCPHCSNRVSLFNPALNLRSQADKRYPRCGEPVVLRLRYKNQVLLALGVALVLMVLAIVLLSRAFLFAGLIIAVVVGIVALPHFELLFAEPHGHHSP